MTVRDLSGSERRELYGLLKDVGGDDEKRAALEWIRRVGERGSGAERTMQSLASKQSLGGKFDEVLNYEDMVRRRRESQVSSDRGGVQV